MFSIRGGLESSVGFQQLQSSCLIPARHPLPPVNSSANRETSDECSGWDRRPVRLGVLTGQVPIPAGPGLCMDRQTAVPYPSSALSTLRVAEELSEPVLVYFPTVAWSLSTDIFFFTHINLLTFGVFNRFKDAYVVFGLCCLIF